MTTRKFLEAFGFASLRDLPDLERLKAEGLMQRGQGEEISITRLGWRKRSRIPWRTMTLFDANNGAIFCEEWSVSSNPFGRATSVQNWALQNPPFCA